MAGGDANHARSSAAFVSSIKSSARRFTSTISPVKQSEIYSLTDTEYHQGSFSTDRSSTSSRSSNRTAFRAKRASISTASLPQYQERQTTPVKPPRYEATSPLQVPKRKPVPSSPQQRVETKLTRAATASAALSKVSSKQNMAGSSTMTMTPFAPTLRSDQSSRAPSTSQSSISFGQGGGTTSGPPPSLPNPPGSIHNPHTVYQNIQDLASKRISTLDYLRKGFGLYVPCSCLEAKKRIAGTMVTHTGTTLSFSAKPTYLRCPTSNLKS